MKGLILLIVTLLTLNYNPLNAQSQSEFEGQIQSTSLMGSGVRNVVADANGVLGIGDASNSGSFYSIPASAFRSAFNNGISYTASEANASVTGNAQNFDYLLAPVNLPHGSVLKTVTIYFQDNDDDNDMIFELKRFQNSNSATFTPGFASSAGSALSVNSSVEIMLDPPLTVDNQGNGYTILVRSGDFNQPLNPTLLIYNAVFEYN